VNLKVTYYLDIVSSWCYWAEPAWAELKRRYAKSPVEFDWEIALLDAEGMSRSREQADWFYRRSGTIVGSPFMLNSGWLDPWQPEFLAANCVAEAARDFGVTDDRVRLALMEASMRKGQKVADWKICTTIAARAAKLNGKMNPCWPTRRRISHGRRTWAIHRRGERSAADGLRSSAQNRFHGTCLWRGFAANWRHELLCLACVYSPPTPAPVGVRRARLHAAGEK
jgi:hypothetical protein